jgi:4-oxalocrotonate tautomerase
MPMAIVRVVEGVLDDDGKRRVIDRITDALVEVEGRGNEAFRPYVWVILEEVASGHWGVGGHGLTPDDVRGLVAAGAGDR